MYTTNRTIPGVALALVVLAVPALAEEPLTYETHIAPIFAQRCAPCHYPEANKKAKGKFDLTTYALAMQGGENGPSITPGSLEESPLVAMIKWEAEPFMPPQEKFKQLPPEEIELIKAWILAGAKGDAAPPAPEPLPEATSAAEVAVEADWAASPVSALAWSPDGSLVARGGLRTVALYPVNRGVLESDRAMLLPGHADQVRALDFSSDGALLAAAGGKPGRAGEIVLWNAATREAPRRIEAHRDNILDVKFSPDDLWLATASYDKHVMVWNVLDGSQVMDLTDHVDAVYAVAFSPDGKYLATGAGDRTVKLWDMTTGKRLITFSDATATVHAVTFSPDSRFLAAGSADKRIYIWDVPASAEAFTQSSTSAGVLAHSKFAHDGAVLLLAYTPDGASLISSGEDAAVKIWNAATMAEARTLEAQPDWLVSLALSPEGDYLAAGRYDTTLALYQTADGQKTYSSTDGPVVLAAGGMEEKDITQAGRVNVDSVFVNATIPPVINSVSPVRVVRGGTVELAVSGKNLAEARAYFRSNLSVEILANEAKEVPAFEYNSESTGAQIHDNAVPHQLKLKVTIPEDTPPGGQWLYLETPHGLAEPAMFTVLETADTPEQPVEGVHPVAALPLVIIGKIAQTGETDRYRVVATAGEEIVFALTDTGLNPELRIVDAAGALLADNATAAGEAVRRIGFRAPADGEYTLEISDPELRANQGYRLHVGPFPWVMDYFPIGVPAGAAAEIRVAGFNLGTDGPTLAVTAPEAGSPWDTFALPVPAYPGNPIPAPKLAIGSGEEVLDAEPNNEIAAAQALPLNGAANGYLGEAGDWDVYRFDGVANTTMLLEVEAERLGVPLDSVIEILDTSGEVLQRSVARCTAETHVTLFSRDSRSAGLRLDNWSALAMNDYVMAGGEILQVRKIPDYADEDVVFSTLGGQRHSLFGTTPRHHAVYSSVYRVELHPPDATFPANGMPVFPVYWQNDDGFFAGRLSTDARLEFEAPESGVYYVRVRDALGSDRPQPYRLALRTPRPDFQIAAGTYRVNIAEGGAYPVAVNITRRDGFDAPVQVWIEGLPEGVGASAGVILPDDESTTLRLWAGAGAQSTATEGTIIIRARAETAAGPLDHQAGMGTITVVRQQPDLAVHADRDVLEIGQGGSGPLAVRLDRHNGFTARVPIDVLNLPYGVSVMDTGLNGILVRDNESDRAMNLYVEPWVETMEREIYIQARIEAPSNGAMKYLSQPVTLKIVRGTGGVGQVARSE